eukprot:2150699-Amphidinium_carterae.1
MASGTAAGGEPDKHMLELENFLWRSIRIFTKRHQAARCIVPTDNLRVECSKVSASSFCPRTMKNQQPHGFEGYLEPPQTLSYEPHEHINKYQHTFSEKTVARNKSSEALHFAAIVMIDARIPIDRRVEQEVDGRRARGLVQRRI